MFWSGKTSQMLACSTFLLEKCFCVWASSLFSLVCTSSCLNSNKSCLVKLIKPKFSTQPLCFGNRKSSLKRLRDRLHFFTLIGCREYALFKWKLRHQQTHICLRILNREREKIKEWSKGVFETTKGPFCSPYHTTTSNFHTKPRQALCVYVCVCCVCHSRLVLCSACLSLFVWLAGGS